MIRTLPFLLGALGVAGCMQTSDTASGSSSATAAGARATLAAADGASRGSATFADGSGGIVVRATAEGLPPGTHGIHIHTTGRCDAPDFASAGPHWNPTGKQHGRDNPQGAHHGDLPNIVIGSDGRGTLQFTTPGGTLAEMLDADGAALVIHANPDDDRTDPSGNSGGRIACGVIARG